MRAAVQARASLIRGYRSQIRNYSAPTDGSIPAAKKRFVPDDGFYPKGFLLGSAHANVKPSNKTKDDVAVVASEKPCVAAGCFTKNGFRAAPVNVSREVLDKRGGQGVRGVVINSGCANAVTGDGGLQDARIMAKTTDELFDQSQSSSEDLKTLVMSTGVIGQRLPINKILNVLPSIKSALSSSHDKWLGLAKAIMTTDTFPKLVSRQFKLPSHPDTTYTIAGVAKGAGMIHPNMGTLLSVLCTDVSLSPNQARVALSSGVQTSFNSISIDGDTSTNDSVVLLANGAAAPQDVQPLDSAADYTPEAIASGSVQFKNDGRKEDAQVVAQNVDAVLKDLAQLIVRDGEGATKFVTIDVIGSIAPEVARRLGMKVATSSLVKTAMYGRDANWGRILCAIGNTPGFEYADREGRLLFSVGFGIPGTDEVMPLVVKDVPVGEVDEAKAAKILAEEDIRIVIELDDEAAAQAAKPIHRFWTCDFSHEYVTINADYRT